MRLPPFAKLPRAALLTVLFGAATMVGASTPLLAGEGDAPIAQRRAPIEKKKTAKTTKKSKRSRADDGKKKKKEKGAKEAPRTARSPDDSGPNETAPLHGRTIDFEYDGRDRKIVGLAYSGRVFVPDSVLEAGKPVPLVVFFHGLNKELVRHRWMGGGDEGDVRRIVLALIESGDIPPVIVAGPGSIQPDAVSDGASFPYFDFDNFMALTKQSLNGVADFDPQKIIVTGHSGAGCSERGGIVSAIHSSFVPQSVISVDTCMMMSLADALSTAPPSTNVIVTWQSSTWPERDFDVFKAEFKKGSAGHPAGEGVLRTLDELPTNSHDATVAMTFKKYLPILLR